MPELFEWIEGVLGQEQGPDEVASPQGRGGGTKLLTDWGVSHTTLEEVFINLARKDQPDAAAMDPAGGAIEMAAMAVVPPIATSSPPSVAVDAGGDEAAGSGKASALLPNSIATPKAPTVPPDLFNNSARVPSQSAAQALSIASEGNGLEEAPAELGGDSFKALLYQRANLQRRKLKANVCMGCCPAVCLLLLMLASWALDQITKSFEEEQARNLLLETNRCTGCEQAVKEVCYACLVPGASSTCPDGPSFQVEGRYQFDEARTFFRQPRPGSSQVLSAMPAVQEMLRC